MNSGDRFQQRRAEFGNAVTALDEALSLLQEFAGDERLRKALRDSVIQRFEFCYELAWKSLKAWLDGKGIDARNPKDVLREAVGQGILNDVNGWAEAHENRNLTSHTYDESQAEKVAGFVVTRGAALFGTLRNILKALDPS
jgi:nucleotidyltransferase substrate binding protein (TIGR01987 family)